MAHMTRIIVRAFYFFLLLNSAAVLGATLGDEHGEVFLGGELRYVEDVRSSFSIEEAREALYSEGVNWDAPGFPVFGFSSSSYWASVSVDNSFATDQQWIMKMAFAPTDEIDFYYQDRSANWVHKKGGDSLPFSVRDVEHHAITFSFPVYAGEIQTFYFRVKNSGSVQLPISAISLENLQEQTRSEYWLIGMLYGALLVMAFYSCAIWATTHDKSYLFFSAFLLSGLLYNLSMQGLAFQYFWPDNIYWSNRAMPTFTMLACASGLAFVSRFLNLQRLSRKLNNLMFMLSMATLVIAVVGLVLPLRWIIRVDVLVVLGVLAAVMYVTYFGLKRNNRQAAFLAIAWSILMLSVLIEMAQRLGVNMPPTLSFHSIQFGTVLGAMIIALGLGDQINSLLKNYGSVQNEMLKANQQKIEALQNADDLKEEFIANVSHELKTPLTGIIGLSEIILDSKKGQLDPSTLESLNMIRISGQRLANLVNDVIDFSSIKHGELELDRRAVDLKKVCSLVIKMCRSLVGDKPIQLAEHFPDEPVIVLGDEDRLQQILFNLVSNAIKFTPRGWVAISIELIDIDVRISVKDTGVGISREQQARIFNRFYQIDSTATRERGGTGLGLAISQKLVELHGTEIVLRSSLGEGSTFYFDLPLYGGQLLSRDSNASELSAPSQKDAAELASRPLEVKQRTERRAVAAELEEQVLSVELSSKRRKVLVVDDEYLNVKIVKEHLSAHYEIVTALGGLEALEIIEKDKPDLLVLDLMMPIMTGFELCQRVRQKYSLDELPIVILTAKNRVEDLVKGLSMGANDYISKPFSKEELRVRVGKQVELLDLREVRKENEVLNWQLARYQESEKRLRERETRLAGMLNITSDALISINEQGTIVFINKPAEDLLGVDSDQYTGQAFSELAGVLESLCKGCAEHLRFPFDESVLSNAEEPSYYHFTLMLNDGNSEQATPTEVRMAVLTLSLEYDFYLLTLERVEQAELAESEDIENAPLPELISQINKNVERTQLLSRYLSKITPEDLQKHKHLFSDLENVDKIIGSLTSSLPTEDDSEQAYREALVKLMQDCHYFWQKVTGESIIDLAEKSRIWSVSIDNGRLRTRSMNRYLSVDKLPKNPRWRQVARTAYFVLSKVSEDQEAKRALEKSVATLQEIVEKRALN
ncbi:MAG: 7TM diverse intracellular signaling domain-containing protein [Pseudohongiellaceae bacterium]|nr:7TM diverse intracellular signaling domain-containing protein [Pseudohongiellaceae bacterium]